MSAGKINSSAVARIRTAMVAVSVMAALASAPSRAWAICGMPSGLAGALQMSDADAAVAPRTTQLKEMAHGPNEPIVGMWMITVTDSHAAVTDRVFAGWTGDGLEFDQDISPILTGYVCYGTWVKVGRNTYGLTHPFFDFMDVNANGEGTAATVGTSDGTSGYFNYTVTVAKDGKTFTGKENVVVVTGLNPYDPAATVLFTATENLAATKISVNPSQLP
jgi:hypothetical protein